MSPYEMSSYSIFFDENQAIFDSEFIYSETPDQIRAINSIKEEMEKEDRREMRDNIKELAEGGLFDLTLRVPGIPENDIIQIFGIYPYLETLVPQLILSIILLITFMMAHYRGKLAALRKQLTAAKT
mgnify:CR=1 FL=1